MKTAKCDLVGALRYSRRTAEKILRKYPDAVDDVLQTAAEHALRSFAQFRGDAKFNTWFTRIVANDALGYLRRRRQPMERKTVSLDSPAHNKEGELVTWDFPDRRPSPYAQVSYSELVRLVGHTINHMSPTVRNGASLLLDGCSAKSPSEKARRFRARKILQEAILNRNIGTPDRT